MARFVEVTVRLTNAWEERVFSVPDSVADDDVADYVNGPESQDVEYTLTDSGWDDYEVVDIGPVYEIGE